jgi:transcriptional regulator of arginine metabolism
MNQAERLRTIFKEAVTSFDVAQNIVVVKTMPGLAPAACSTLDSMHIPDMVGTLAGDDTALLIMRTNGAAEGFCSEIHRMLK